MIVAQCRKVLDDLVEDIYTKLTVYPSIFQANTGVFFMWLSRRVLFQMGVIQ